MNRQNKTLDEKIEQVVLWIREKVEAAHCDGAVVGISGGIDSAVVAYLMKKAFPQNSLGIILPCQSSPLDKEDALKVADACKIDYLEVDLTQTHVNLFETIQKNMEEKAFIDEKPNRLSDANLRARLRMSTIYCVANMKNYLVMGTDNAAELYTGYFTKYGDGGVDLLPIARIVKKEVYEWAEYLGVPQSVIKRPPSGGLWEGQTDELEMGTTYDCVDALVRGQSIPQKDREIIEALHKKTEHKRNMPDMPPEF